MGADQLQILKSQVLNTTVCSKFAKIRPKITWVPAPLRQRLAGIKCCLNGLELIHILLVVQKGFFFCIF